MKKQDKHTPPSQTEHLLIALEIEAGFGLDALRLSPTNKPAGATGDPLADCKEKAGTCTACPLAGHRNRVVFGEGDITASLMFVGEAPGEDEDREGRPFVGKAGRLLNRMIQAMGLTREDVYIANVLKCRPPDNRTPTPEEAEACRGFLDTQIRTVSPRVIVALGAPAAKRLLDTNKGINTLRGKSYSFPADDEIVVVPTFHPAYLLRYESEKGKAWNDLQIAMKILD